MTEHERAYPDTPAFYAVYPGDRVRPHPELPIMPAPKPVPARSGGWGAT